MSRVNSTGSKNFLGVFFAALIACLVLAGCPGGSDKAITGAGAPTAPVVTCTAAATPAISPSLVTSRVSGVAPLAVFFDASATTTTPATPRPFHDLEYRWDFGDTAGSPVSGTIWVKGSRAGFNSRNSATGPVAAHVFETPGTYSVAVSAFDGTNTATVCSAQITVQDPDVVFAGAKTVCVAATTMPAPGVNGCPAAATPVQQSDWPTIVTTYALTGKRVLLNGGDVFTGAANSTYSAAGPSMIASYGAGRAVIQTTAIAAGSKILILNNATDLRLVDLEFDGLANGDRVAMSGSGSMSQLTFLRLNIHDIGAGIEMPCSAATAPVHDQIYMQDGIVQRLNSTGAPNTHGILTCASRTAIVGNLFDDSTSGSAEHMVRIQFMDRGVISNNQVQAVATGNEMIALRAPCSSNPTCASGDYFPAAGLVGAAATTKQVVISDNLVKTNTFAGIKVGRVNVGDNSALMSDIIIERNYFQGQAGGGTAVTLAGVNRVSVRNSLIDLTASASGTGMSWDNAAPTSDGVWIYNNSAYRDDAGNFFFADMPNGPAVLTGAAIINNVGYAPLAGSYAMVRDLNAVNPTSSNNSPSNTTPVFAATPPVLASHWMPQAGSYTIGGGLVVPVWSDFFLVTQPATRDIGAVIH